MDQDQTTIILFDGVCNLCNGLVKFVIKHDPHGRFRFAALQSEAGKRLLTAAGLSDAGMDTVVLIEHADGATNGSQVNAYVRSDAALRIMRRLGGSLPLLYAFIAVPRPLRDIVYGFVARNRYKWFGQQDACMLPTPDIRRRFIES